MTQHIIGIDTFIRSSYFEQLTENDINTLISFYRDGSKVNYDNKLYSTLSEIKDFLKDFSGQTFIIKGSTSQQIMDSNWYHVSVIGTFKSSNEKTINSFACSFVIEGFLDEQRAFIADQNFITFKKKHQSSS